MHAYARLLCLVAWTLLAACEESSATQLVVSVNTDFVIPDELDKVRIEVHTQAASGDFSTRITGPEVTLTNRDALPLSLALSKRGSTYRVQVTVTGFQRKNLIIRRRAIASFQTGRILSLPINLLSACASKYEQCEKRSMTCGDSGGCEAVERTELEPWGVAPNFSAPAASTPAERDDGVETDAGNELGVPDAGSVDAGLDAGMVAVPLDPNAVVDLALGAGHSCALLRSGAVYCWGANESGQLGRGGDTSCPATQGKVCFVPAPVVELPSDIVKIVAGASFSCALRSQTEGQGQVLCWGENSRGQLGTEGASSSFPAYVRRHAQTNRLEGANTMAAGRNFACARVDGSLYCWGDNSLRQLAIINDGWFPEYVAAAIPHWLTQVSAFDLGDDFGCARVADNIRCWGTNEKRQMGVEDAIDNKVIAPWTQLPDELALGGEHTCLREGTKIYCAGRAEEGQLGVDLFNQPAEAFTACANTIPGTDPPEPVPNQAKASCTEAMQEVRWMATPVSLGAGDQSTCALDERENVWCWGIATDGPAVNEVLTSHVELPQKVPNLVGVLRLAVGFGHACAFTRSNETFCWGRGKTGQLGAEPGVNPVLPRRVALPRSPL